MAGRRRPAQGLLQRLVSRAVPIPRDGIQQRRRVERDGRRARPGDPACVLSNDVVSRGVIGGHTRDALGAVPHSCPAGRAGIRRAAAGAGPRTDAHRSGTPRHPAPKPAWTDVSVSGRSQHAAGTHRRSHSHPRWCDPQDRTGDRRKP